MAFCIGFYAYAIIGHTRGADQLLPQLLMEQFDTFPIQCRQIEHMHEGVWFRKNNFRQNYSCENLDNFSLIRLLYMHWWCLHGPINSYHNFWWSNLILCLQYRHIQHIHEGVWFRKNNFRQNYSCENLDNFSLTRQIRRIYIPDEGLFERNM